VATSSASEFLLAEARTLPTGTKTASERQELLINRHAQMVATTSARLYTLTVCILAAFDLIESFGTLDWT